MFREKVVNGGSVAFIAGLVSLFLVACESGDGANSDPFLDPINAEVSENQITSLLSADQLVPPLNISASSGVATLSVDANTGAISGHIRVSGLSSPARMAHINVAPTGTNGPVLIALSRSDDGQTFSVPPGAALDAVGIDHYLNNELYLNVRTDDYPAGEIRGQIRPHLEEGRTRFKVTITNMSNDMTLRTPSNGSSTSVPLSPGIYVVHSSTINPLVTEGMKSDSAMELFAEEGNPYQWRSKVPGAGVFDTPDNQVLPGPINSSESYTFTITAHKGDYLALATMFMQSNDWFYLAGEDGSAGIALFDAAGRPVSGDVSQQVTLWDAGTEADEEPGTGASQPLRQLESGESGTATTDASLRPLVNTPELDDLNSVLSGDVIRVVLSPLAQ